MGKLKYLIIHETATPKNMKVDGEDIRHWHTNPKPKGRGWSKVGYSDLLKRNGEIEQLVEYDEDQWVNSDEITNGAAGYNGVSRHICLVGGLDDSGNASFVDFFDLYTDAQFVKLQDYIKRFLGVHPHCKVLGHYQVNNHKTCPGFDVRAYLKLINIPAENIFS